MKEEWVLNESYGFYPYRLSFTLVTHLMKKQISSWLHTLGNTLHKSFGLKSCILGLVLDVISVQWVNDGRWLGVGEMVNNKQQNSVWVSFISS